MTCPHLLKPELARRPSNALNIEIGSPLYRCILKRPSHWGENISGIRWIGSGGDLFVFGFCTPVDCEIAREAGFAPEAKFAKTQEG